MLFASHHLVFTMKHTPPPLVLLASAVLSMRIMEKKSDGVTTWSGIGEVSHVSVKHKMLQFLMSHWKATLALRLYYFPEM